MGATGRDITLSEVALHLFPYSIECKSRKAIAIYGWYAQAASHGTEVPLLVIKENRMEPLVVLSLEDFMELIKPK